MKKTLRTILALLLAGLTASGQTPKTINDFPAATTITGAEYFPVWQGGMTKKIALSNLPFSYSIVSNQAGRLALSGLTLKSFVFQTDTPDLIWIPMSTPTSTAGNWRAIPLTDSAGNLIVDFTLPDVSSIVPTAYTLGRVGSELRLGDGSTTGGVPVASSGSGFSGAGIEYVVVTVTNNATTNGTNLIAAYTAAKSLSPNGAAKSATNRVALLLPPAHYIVTSGALVLDGSFVDLVGLSSEPSHQWIESNATTLTQTASDVVLRNLQIHSSKTTGTLALDGTDPAAYFPDADLPLTVLNNVWISTNRSNNGIGAHEIRYTSTASSSTWRYVRVFNLSGGTSTGIGTLGFSGKAYFCEAGNYAFAGNAGTIATGAIIENCTAGSGAFGEIAIGATVRRCTGFSSSFFGAISGVVEDTVGGFGGSFSSTSRLYKCRITGGGTFATPATGGKQILCIDGTNSVITR